MARRYCGEGELVGLSILLTSLGRWVKKRNVGSRTRSSATRYLQMKSPILFSEEGDVSHTIKAKHREPSN
jgi:hypothetical protein